MEISKAECAYYKFVAAKDEGEYAENAGEQARARAQAAEYEADWRTNYPDHAAAIDARDAKERAKVQAAREARKAENARRFNEREYGI